MLLRYTALTRNRACAAFLRDPASLLGTCFAKYPNMVTEELTVSEPTAWGLFSTPGACCALTGEESMGTEMNHGCSCTREGSGSWWGSWWDNRHLPRTLFYLHKYGARDEQTRVEDPWPSQHPPSDCTDSYRSAPRGSSSSPPSSQPNGHQIRADAYRCLLHAACKAALLEYEDFLWL